MTNRALYSLLVLFVTVLSNAQHRNQLLMSKWDFRQDTSKSWYKATVPGTLYQDLYNNHLIPDPFFSDNEQKVQWVETKSWEYKTEFELNGTEFNCPRIELEFEGLDTYARIYVNGNLILNADNMFRSWTINIRKQVKPGKNTVRVVFDPTSKKGKKLAAQLPYTLPEGERVFTRKAQYDYGWDFAPRLVACGIWKPVRIHFYNKIRIKQLSYFVKSMNTEHALLGIVLETDCIQKGKYLIKASLEGSVLKTETRSLNLNPGLRSDTLWMDVANPQLWWCRGMGEAFLYTLKVELNSELSPEDHAQMHLGLRKIELVRKADSLGSSFYFKLNDVPLYAKGANVVPSGQFPERSLSDEQLVQKAKEAGMNMLRVWGGGQYGSDAFYEACDKSGILVWQDMMFACAMYPGDKSFADNVIRETEFNLKRIGDHPSLALICGNNESEEGWYNWGWQKQNHYSYQDSLLIWKQYQSIFQEAIPKLCAKFLNDIPYLNSSPVIGWGHPESLTQGDSHYWGVWWGMEPVSVYRKKVGRFMSEFGFQSWPDYSTLKEICSSDDLRLDSPGLRSHQKNKKGDETILTYMKRDYKVPDSLFRFVYTSQLLQRDAMQIAIESQRAGKPNCMGSLFWQFNDCWPGISWSSLDYYGRSKALYHALKRLYAPILITSNFNNEKVQVKLVSDSNTNVTGTLYCELKNFKGEILWQNKKDLTVLQFSVTPYAIPFSDLPEIDPSANYFYFRFQNQTGLISENRMFFKTPKYLKLPACQVHLSRLSDNTIELTGTEFIKDLYLYSDENYLDLSDNYFDLEPGAKKILHLKNKDTLPPQHRIKCLSLNDF